MIMKDLKHMDCQKGNFDVVGATLGMIGAIGILLLAHSCSREDMPNPIPKPASAPVNTQKVAYANYFKKNGSKSPDEMAAAVLATRSPRVLAAIAVKESRGNHDIRNGGHQKKHHGAFQVNPRWHGAVPHDALGQARQAERILTELTNSLGFEKGLALYAGEQGTNRGKYSRTILAELSEVPE